MKLIVNKNGVNLENIEVKDDAKLDEIFTKYKEHKVASMFVAFSEDIELAEFDIDRQKCKEFIIELY